MSSTQKLKQKIQPASMTDMLNQVLANAIDFRLSAKQAHWNVKGENFIALHELFDKISLAADEYADMLAERVMQLGGTAQGGLQTVSCQSSLSVYPADIRNGKEHALALSAAISTLADTARQAIDSAAEAHDAVTADILTEITRGLDKLRWLIQSHIT